MAPPAPCATIRLLGALNDFLPAAQRGRAHCVDVSERPAVKHPIEALGVPHPEVEALFVDGAPASFATRIGPGAAVMAWPPGPGIPRPMLPLRPPPPAPPAFVVDTHLGRLAAYLRLLGFDTLYSNAAADPDLAACAATEQRILLTRDRGLLMRAIVIHGHWLRATEPRAQLVAVVRRHALAPHARPFSRCRRCNGLLRPVAKAEVLPLLEPKTRLYYDDFEQCEQCGQVYWQGSHHARTAAFLGGVLDEARRAPQEPPLGSGRDRPVY